MAAFGDIATAVTALASMLAAGAAWRSASESSSASADAREAVALIIPPQIDLETTVDVNPQGRLAGTIQLRIDDALWPASDLQLEVRYRDGRTRRYQRERLNPFESWHVLLEGVGTAGADGYDEFRDLVETVAVSYSDERGIARYERKIAPNHARGGPYIDLGVERLR